jgi:hypothetical protein
MVGQLPADTAPWRWAAASKIGTAHIRKGTRKQDSFACFAPREEILCAIVCDGAGSAPLGGEGASLVCRTISRGIRSHFANATSLPEDEHVWVWIDQARDLLVLAAKRREQTRRAFASTLVLLLAAPEGVLVAHIGDGAAVARLKEGGWETLSSPANGEYASTTFFVTDDPAPQLRITRYEAKFDAFVSFTDGIESLALDLKTMSPHEPFFRVMMTPLDKLAVPGRDAGLSRSLGDFLASGRVCGKTDDDKTVILASCK